MFEGGRELGEQRIQGENLAGPALAGRRYGGHGRTVEHARHRLRDARRGGGVPFQEIGQPREHDAAHDAIGQIVSEGNRGGKGLDAGVAVALFQREALTGRLAHRGGDAVHHHRGIALDHFQKQGAAGGDPLHGGVGDAHRLALPGDSKSGVEIDVPPIVENDRQEFTKRRRVKTYLAA